MPSYRITAPDGHVYNVTPPEGTNPSQAEILAMVQQQHQGSPPQTIDQKGELSQARVNAGLQGALAGFGDEGLGAFAATMDALTGRNGGSFDNWSEHYANWRDTARGQLNEYRQERPWESFGAMLGGGALTAPVFGAAARGAVGVAAPGTAAVLAAGKAGLGARIAEGALAGTIGGATTGFGMGEGDAANRTLSSVVGAGTGGALGAALPALGTTVVAPAARWIGSRLGLVNSADRAAEIAGQHLNYQSGKVGQPTPNLTQMAQGAGNQTAVPMAIADLNESMRSLAGAVSRSPGQARETMTNFVNNRQLGNPVMGQAGGGQWAGTLDDISRTVSPSVSARRTADSIVAARSQAAKPLYEQAFSVGNITSPELKELAQIPTMRTALNEGRAMAQQEGTLSSRTPYDPNSTSLPIQAWHYAKMAIDDMIGAATRAGENTKARALLTMQKRLLTELGTATNGAYTQARQTFAGHSALLNALEEGQQILTKSLQPEDIAAQMKGLSQGEQEMYRAGVAQSMRNMVMNTSRQNNAAAPVLNVPAISEKLRAAFGNFQNFADFMGRVGARSEQFKTFAEITKGSQTAPRLAADEALNQGIQQGAPTNAVQAFAQSGKHGVYRWFMDHVNNAGGLNGVSAKVKSQLANLLISDNPASIKMAAQMIDNAAAAAARRQVAAGQLRLGAGQGLNTALLGAVH